MQYQLATEKVSFIKRFYLVIVFNLLSAIAIPLIVSHKIDETGFLWVIFLFCFMTILMSWRYRKYVYKINCLNGTMQVNYLDYFNESEVQYDKGKVKITCEIVPSRSFIRSHLIRLEQEGKSTVKIYSMSYRDDQFWYEGKINEVFGELTKWKGNTSPKNQTP